MTEEITPISELDKAISSVNIAVSHIASTLKSFKLSSKNISNLRKIHKVLSDTHIALIRLEADIIEDVRKERKKG